jgi:hypothetical protein
MECPNLEQIKRFDESNRLDLDGVVLAALDLFMRQGVPRLDLGRCQKPLVAGSGKAAATVSTRLFGDGVGAPWVMPAVARARHTVAPMSSRCRNGVMA